MYKRKRPQHKQPYNDKKCMNLTLKCSNTLLVDVPETHENEQIRIENASQGSKPLYLARHARKSDT